jgi:hypothetical protein
MDVTGVMQCVCVCERERERESQSHHQKEGGVRVSQSIFRSRAHETVVSTVFGPDFSRKLEAVRIHSNPGSIARDHGQKPKELS